MLAGVTLDTKAGMIDVYLADTSSPAQAPMKAALTTAQRALVRVHKAPLSSAALDEVMSHVSAVVKTLLAHNVPVEAWWPDFTAGAVDVSLRSATQETIQTTKTALLGLPVQISSTNKKSQFIPPVHVPRSRVEHSIVVPSSVPNSAYDYSPWEGGDFIFDSTAGAFCSSSWPVSEGSTQYMMTAGHCGPNGDYWLNEAWNGTYFGGAGTLGVAEQNTLPSNVDAQLIPTAATPAIWAGTYPNNTADAISGSDRPVVGEVVCNGGAYDGTICGATVTTYIYDGCIAVSGTNPPTSGVCHIFSATENGFAVVGEGDSGGPVYAQTATGVTGLGLNSLEETENLACPAFTARGNVCSDTMYFTGLNAILSSYGAALSTS